MAVAAPGDAGGGADGDQEAGRGLAALPSPLDSVDDMRSTARWTIATTGVVGAALISGGPLIAVGQVHGVGHALLAGAGLLLALIGVGLAIWSTSKVLAPRLITPADLRSKALKGLREKLEEEPEQFFGVAGTTVSGLLLHRPAVASLARQLAAASDAGLRDLLALKLGEAQEKERRSAPYVRWLLVMGHAWLVKRDLDRSRWFTLGGGVLVVAGAVLFFIATGGAGPTYVPVVTVSPTATTVPAGTPGAASAGLPGGVFLHGS
jgi:hypothetical protein